MKTIPVTMSIKKYSCNNIDTNKVWHKCPVSSMDTIHAQGPFPAIHWIAGKRALSFGERYLTVLQPTFPNGL